MIQPVAGHKNTLSRTRFIPQPEPVMPLYNEYNQTHSAPNRPPALQVIANTLILPSPIHGEGLWATNPIPPAELCQLHGQPILFTDYRLLIDHQHIQPPAEWNALSREWLLIRPFRTSYSFINHARNPNCRIQPVNACTVAVQAIRPIKKGEELTLDYRDEPLTEWPVSGLDRTFL